MSLGVGSDKEGGVVSQRRVLRVTGDDAVGSSDADRFRDDADVVDSMESDLCRLRPSVEGRRGCWEGAEELVEICMVKEGVDDHPRHSSRPWASPLSHDHLQHAFITWSDGSYSSHRPLMGL
jgi:hypothetical protein